MCNSDKKTKYEVADIFRLYGDEYIKKRPLPAHYLKVIHDIKVCRSDYLGGHIYKCDFCGYKTALYNSCRNRHCPKCQFTARLKWVEKRKSEILPVGYFHNVFTLPHELNPLALCNKTICLNLLFKAVGETLSEFGSRELEGQPGFITILHSWTQTLLDHFHIHCVIPAGVLSNNKDRWNFCSENFLFAVKALSKMFRGKYIDLLKKAYHNGEFILPGRIEYLSNKNSFNIFVNELWNKQWVVYAKKSFANPEKVLEYLSRYTHRVAIANHRIISAQNGKVTFKYKDRASARLSNRKNDNIDKEMTLTAEEFIRRFLLHVLPEKFMKIRYYGFLGNRNRKENVRLCRELMGCGQVTVHDLPEGIPELILQSTGVDITICPQCGEGQMQIDSKILSYPEKMEYDDTS